MSAPELSEMSPRPHDFDPEEEQDLHELFGVLRREIHEVIQGLATQILHRITVEEDEQGRMAQPELLKIIEDGVLDLMRLVMQLLGREGAPGEEPLSPREGDEDE